MRIKKYSGPTEKEAMLKVKGDLGSDALIVSVKNIKPGGIYRLFKKPYVEVTAAVDEKMNYEKSTESTFDKKSEDDEELIKLLREFSKKSDLQNNSASPINTQEMLTKEIVTDFRIKDSGVSQKEEVQKSEDVPIINVLYEQLLENDIDEKIINEIMVGLPEIVIKNNVGIDELISILYKRVAKIMSDYDTIKLDDKTSNVVVFVGPTGVGKTTTIAKIASHFTLSMNKKVALLTADTYRIAAVEQLRTYAEILNIPIRAVYSSAELNKEINNFKNYDLVLIDTAGRSPRNKEHHNELVDLLNVIDKKEIFLVLSLSTTYKDLKNIVLQYKDICNFKVIITKLDETTSYGNLLNIKMFSNSKLSYVTFGQNVPDDISEIDVHDMTKKILGGCE